MQVLILSARPGWHTDQLCRALSARGHQPRVDAYESLVAAIGRPAGRPLPTGGRPLSTARRSTAGRHQGEADLQVGLSPSVVRFSAFTADAVIARIIPNGSLEQIIYRVDALHWIEDRGIPVINSARAIERSVDKFYTTALLQQAGLPVPETVVCERADDAMAAIRRFLGDGGEVIIKPIFGSMGHGLVRIADAELAWRVVRPLEQMRAVFYVQRAIDHGGRDIRLFVAGDRLLGAIERTAAAGDWRTNMARGAVARPIDVPAEWRDYALRAARAVGADYAGVDLLQSRAGDAFVLEVNGIPGWEGLQAATGIDVAAAIVEQVEARVAARRDLAVEGVNA
jgi:RimK family alpha-L-glutamate ligase